MVATSLPRTRLGREEEDEEEEKDGARAEKKQLKRKLKSMMYREKQMR